MTKFPLVSNRLFLLLLTLFMENSFCADEKQKHLITSLCSSSSSSTTTATTSNNYKVDGHLSTNQTLQFDATVPICACTNENSLPWGLRIDCTDRAITYEQFQAEILPFATEHLDLSWNQFDDIPDFFGKSLQHLKFSHNQINKIADKNFANIPNLRELDLSWNIIELISMNAFGDLSLLQRLDLSHNNLKRINFNTFAPLIALEDLNLSWNRRLNESGIELKELDFFLAFSITTKLKILKLGHCNLNSIILTHGIGLQHLYLNWNNLTVVSDIPRGLKLLDLSGNPIDKLQPKYLPHLFQLETLLLEDMPNLKIIEDYSLFGLPSMRTLSFQNSRKLKEFSPYAFGMNVILNETDIILESLNLRGTSIKSLNSSLHLVFDTNFKNLNLAGVPLLCNCDLYWLRQLQISDETDGRCSEPSRLRGWKLSKLSEEQFDCETSPKWLSDILNGLLIILLIILCLGGIWLIVLGLRPKKCEMRKIGANSPYAPVTIEPNRAEY